MTQVTSHMTITDHMNMPEGEEVPVMQGSPRSAGAAGIGAT